MTAGGAYGNLNLTHTNARNTIEDRRYVHIIFDKQVMTALGNAVKKIEQVEKAKKALLIIGSLLE